MTFSVIGLGRFGEGMEMPSRIKFTDEVKFGILLDFQIISSLKTERLGIETNQ